MLRPFRIRTGKLFAKDPEAGTELSGGGGDASTLPAEMDSTEATVFEFNMNEGGSDEDMETAILESQGLSGVSDTDLQGVDDESKDSESEKKDSKETDEIKKDAESKDQDVASKSDKKEDTQSDQDGEKSTDAKSDEDSKEDKTETKTEDKTEDSTEDKTADSESSESDAKPPKGYVKIEALREARGIIKELKGDIAVLKVQKYESKDKSEDTQLVTKAETERFKDFEVLSEKKFDDKFEDDPTAGMKYLRKLNDFRDYEQRLQKQEDLKTQKQQELDYAAKELQVIYDSSKDKMDELVPGLFDDQTVQKEMTDFANSIGFTDELFYLTNPETRVILPGEDNPLVLGEQAADILNVLVTAKKQMAEKVKTDTKDLEKDLRVKIEKELRETIEAEMLEKFKQSDSKKTKIKSLDDIPTTASDARSARDVLSGADFAKLSEKEQEAYLSGVDL